MDMATTAGRIGNWLSHERGHNRMIDGDRFYSQSANHVRSVILRGRTTDLKSAARSATSQISSNANAYRNLSLGDVFFSFSTYRLVHAWPNLGVPSFDWAPKLSTGLVYIVVIRFVVHRTCNAVTKFAFFKWFRFVGDITALRPEVAEFVFHCTESRLNLFQTLFDVLRAAHLLPLLLLPLRQLFERSASIDCVGMR